MVGWLLVAASSADLAKEQSSFTLRTLKELGFVPNLEKSQLVPVQRIQHVGLVWESVAFTVSIPDDKILAV